MQCEEHSLCSRHQLLPFPRVVKAILRENLGVSARHCSLSFTWKDSGNSRIYPSMQAHPDLASPLHLMGKGMRKEKPVFLEVQQRVFSTMLISQHPQRRFHFLQCPEEEKAGSEEFAGWQVTEPRWGPAFPSKSGQDE